MSPELISTVSFEFPLLLVALLIARYVRVGMLHYTGIVVILAIVKGVMAYASGQVDTAIWVAVVAVAAVVLSVFLAGVFGSRLSVDNHKSILGGVALFPWYLGVPYVVVYVMLSMLVLAVVSTVSSRRAFSSVGHRVMSPERARKEMSEDDYNRVMQKARTIFALPIVLSAFVTIAVLSM